MGSTALHMFRYRAMVFVKRFSERIKMSSQPTFHLKTICRPDVRPTTRQQRNTSVKWMTTWSVLLYPNMTNHGKWRVIKACVRLSQLVALSWIADWDLWLIRRCTSHRQPTQSSHCIFGFYYFQGMSRYLIYFSFDYMLTFHQPLLIGEDRDRTDCFWRR